MDATEAELREMLKDRRLVRWPTEPQWNDIWMAANADGFTGSVSSAVYSVDSSLLDNDWIDMMDVEPADAKMMWAEIRVRRSVSPFVEENKPFTDAQKAESAFKAQYDDLIRQGWKVVSNAPEGVEFSGPRKMKTVDKVLLALGVLTLVAYGLGVLLIAVALVDYYAFTSPATTRLARPGKKAAPAPTEESLDASLKRLLRTPDRKA